MKSSGQQAQGEHVPRELRCYECGERGHISTRCPSRALYTAEGAARKKPPDPTTRRDAVYRSGFINDKAVDNILLDTGCAQTLVHRKLVPPGRESGDGIIVQCAHVDEVSYPTAEVNIVINGEVFIVVAGVSESLPVSVLLGRDVPQLVCIQERGDHEGDPETESEEALVVTIRAQAQTETEILASQEQREEAVGVRSKSPSTESESDLGREQEVLGAEFDPDFFCEGRDRRKQSRRQKCAGRQEVTAEHKAESQHPLDGLSAEELQALQGNDPTLAMVRDAADGETSSAGWGCFRRDGVIYRSWTPPGQDPGAITIEQLVLPQPCRQTVLELSHQIPLAGHLGKSNTADRIRQRFYWPTLIRDVERFCQSCQECQKCSTKRGPRAPMVPLPHRPGAVQMHRDGCPRALTPQQIGKSIYSRDL